jgi:hypothetical protein
VRSLTYASAPTATLWGLTNAGHLVSFTLQNPGTFVTDNAVTGLQSGEETVVAIDVRPADGVLYGLTTAGRLVPLDPATGAAGAGITLTANPTDTAAPVFAGLNGTRFGMDFYAFDDTLRIHSNTVRACAWSRRRHGVAGLRPAGRGRTRRAAGDRHGDPQQLRGRRR